MAKVSSRFSIRSEKTEAWKKYEEELRALKARGGGLYVRAGFLSTEEGAREGGVNNATLAAIHEYGTDTVPARPFVGPAFDRNQEKYEAALRGVVEGMLSGRAGLSETVRRMELLGLAMVADMRQYVVGGDQVPPPNAPAVLERKLEKSSGSPWGVRTLVDTGQMLGSAAHEVFSGAQPKG